MRSRIYQIIETAQNGDTVSRVYDISMMLLIVVSLVPLCFKSQTRFFVTIDYVCTLVFCFDYLFRWITADHKLRRGAASFLLYPLTPFAIIDLLSIIPTFTTASAAFRVLRTLRLLRSFRVLRAFKFFRYSKQIDLIVRVIKSNKVPLLSVLVVAIGYIIISALVMFNVEPDSFNTFFDALYWATTALTTVGYGDIYPVSTIGRIISMISSLTGIAVVALPSGIITSGYLAELGGGGHNG